MITIKIIIIIFIVIISISTIIIIIMIITIIIIDITISNANGIIDICTLIINSVSSAFGWRTQTGTSNTDNDQIPT